MIIPETVVAEITKVESKFFKNQFDKIFSWKDLENLLNLRPFLSHNRFHIINDRSRESWRKESWVSDINALPPSIVAAKVKQFHCYFTDASRVNEKVNSICRELDNIFVGGAADAHIYFNASDNFNNGFGIHWDMCHNLIIQMEGETIFKVWDKSVVGPSAGAHVKETPAIEVLMQPGDAIFIPLHVYHQAISQSKRLSISFPVAQRKSHESLFPQERHWIKIA